MDRINLGPFGPTPRALGRCPFCGGIAIEYQQGWSTSKEGSGIVRRCQSCRAYRTDTPGSKWCRGIGKRVVVLTNRDGVPITLEDKA